MPVTIKREFVLPDVEKGKRKGWSFWLVNKKTAIEYRILKIAPSKTSLKLQRDGKGLIFDARVSEMLSQQYDLVQKRIGPLSGGAGNEGAVK